MSKGKALIHGISHGLGVVVGTCIVLSSPEEAIKIDYGDIVIIDGWLRWEYPQYESFLAKGAALIENMHGAVYGYRLMSGKFRRPSISGTYAISKEKATDILQNGQEVMVLSPSGQVEKPSDTGPILFTVGTVYEYTTDDKLMTTFKEAPLGVINKPKGPAKIPADYEDMTMAEKMKVIKEKYNK